MEQPTDALAEACQVAGIVTSEEASIADIEKQIADKFRATCAKIFKDTEYRIPKQTVGIYILDDDITPSGIDVWAYIGLIIDDQIKWDGEYHGAAQTLRVSTDGKILAVWQHVPRCRSFSLFAGENYTCPPYFTRSKAIRLATDYEIAKGATTLAEDLLRALRKRIDVARGVKAELQRIANLGEQS